VSDKLFHAPALRQTTMKILFLTLLLTLASRAENPLRGVLQADNLKKAKVAGVGIEAGPQEDTVVLRFHRDVAGSLSVPLPAAARDWTQFKAITWQFTSTSTTRWDLGMHTRNGKSFSVRVQPYQDVPVKAVLPMRFVTHEYMNNRLFKGYWLSAWQSGFDPSDVDALIVRMNPHSDVTLKLGPISLDRDEVDDEVYLSKPVVDEFGQWAPLEWPGKVHSVTELKSAWRKEDAALAKKEDFGFCPYGGWKQLSEHATGFFHTTQVEGKWWFVDPDGHLFFSIGMDCVRYLDSTRVRGREMLFQKLPPESRDSADFYHANVELRYGADKFVEGWKATSAERLKAWGFNTVANWSDPAMFSSPKTPFVVPVSVGSIPRTWQGFPDAYSAEFARVAERQALEQCARFRDESYLVGYFIGNEPHWPYRNLADLILNDSQPSETQAFLRRSLKESGDTEQARAELLGTIARKYFEVVCSAIRKADPHHLILGIRWAGRAPDAVLKANQVFDVFSINIYRFDPPEDQIRHIYELAGRPVLIGEYHFGASERGMAPALVEVKDQTQRGVAYQYYLEHAAAQPAIVGAHYFALVDEPVSSRFDGENYNFGFVDQTDIPYSEIVSFAKETHRRIYPIHAGKLEPASQMAHVE
jgi:hypothetical protein